MAKDYLIFGDGSFILFYNLTNGQQKCYKANSPAAGDGCRYVTGHRSYYLFAFAERCFNPRILVMTYPDFGLVSKLTGKIKCCTSKIRIFKIRVLDGNKCGYLKLAFSDGVYFVSLSTFPEYNLIIWNWRTGEKFTSVKTNFFTNFQNIKYIILIRAPTNFDYIYCFRLLLNNTLLSIAQHATDSNHITVWDLLVCCKKSILKETQIKHTVKANFSATHWFADGTLFVLDVMANVYMVFYYLLIK